MEFYQEEQNVAELKKKHLQKPYAKSLSTDKVVYATDGDPTDTVIVRSLYPHTKACNKVFGVKGVLTIRTLFLMWLKLMTSQSDSLKKKLKYVRTADFLQIDEMKKQTGDEMERLILNHDKDSNPYIIHKTHNEEHIEVKLAIRSNFPTVVLKNINEQGEFVTQVHLFFEEAIKLMKNLNSRFNFYTGNVLKEHTYGELSKDDFF